MHCRYLLSLTCIWFILWEQVLFILSWHSWFLLCLLNCVAFLDRSGSPWCRLFIEEKLALLFPGVLHWLRWFLISWFPFGFLDYVAFLARWGSPWCWIFTEEKFALLLLVGLRWLEWFLFSWFRMIS